MRTRTEVEFRQVENGRDLPDEAAFDVAIELATRAETDAEAMRTIVCTIGKHGTEADIWAMLMDVRGLHKLRLRVLADLEAVERAAVIAARPFRNEMEIGYNAEDEAKRAEAAYRAARPMVAALRRKYRAYASRNVGAWLARICGDRFDYTRRILAIGNGQVPICAALAFSDGLAALSAEAET